MMIVQQANPWHMPSIYDFQYFNCPVCVFKDRSKQEFIDHAFKFHPESASGFSNICDGSLQDIYWPFAQAKVEDIDEQPLENEQSFNTFGYDAKDHDQFSNTSDELAMPECFVLLDKPSFASCDKCSMYFDSTNSLKNHNDEHHQVPL